MTCRYIDPKQAYWYLARGWRIVPLPGNHGKYRVLAVKP